MDKNNEVEQVDITNYDCIFMAKNCRSCKALKKVYCRKEKCSFYQNYSRDKHIPYIIVNGKVHRIK